MAYTEKSLLKASKKDYMNKEMLEFFKDLLIKQKKETLAHIDEVKNEISHMEQEADDLDRATIEQDRMLKLRIIERETFLLHKIDDAMERIADGTYGYCEETGEPIGIKRLLLRPTATFSIEAKEFQEEKERHEE